MNEAYHPGYYQAKHPWWKIALISSRWLDRRDSVETQYEEEEEWPSVRIEKRKSAGVS